MIGTAAAAAEPSGGVLGGILLSDRLWTAWRLRPIAIVQRQGADPGPAETRPMSALRDVGAVRAGWP